MLNITAYFRFALAVATLAIASGILSTASAHRTGESYVYVNVTEDMMDGRFEIDVDHINKAIPLDTNNDGKISQKEFDARAEEIYAYIQPRLKFFQGDEEYSVTVTDHDFLKIWPRLFAKINFEIEGLGKPPERLGASYEFLFDDIDRKHRGLLIIESNTRSGITENESQHSLIFRPGQVEQTFRVDGPRWPVVLKRFIGEGIYHIVPIGYDHILFLISLLLPAVMVLQAGQWTPATGFRQPFIYVVKVVTFFTVAHTITLSLAALNIFRIPAPLVEAVIALSIAIVAANNLRPFLEKRTWTVVFALGLFHGFGFANVLDPLGAKGPTLIPALAGFNIGVEIGQLIIVTTVFPVLYLLRTQPFYKPVILRGGSVVLIAIAMLWFFERTFNVVNFQAIKASLGM